MKKAEINKVLKELGYGFVKVSTGNDFDNGKCFTGWDGKRVKGIPGGSHGPMTATNAYQERNKAVIDKVTSSLRCAGMVERDGVLESQDGKIKLTLTVSEFPKYTKSAGYDDGYMNCYIQPLFQ